MKAGLVTLGDVLEIDSKSVAPELIADGATYVGLESIGSGGSLDESVCVSSGELKSAKFVFDDRHVLFGKLRPNLGKVARPTGSGVCSTDIFPLLPSNRLDRNYLAHFLLLPSTIALAASRTTGVNLPRINGAILKSFEIPLPPLPEQRRIADILDRADDLRAQRRHALELLRSMESALFDGMFHGFAGNRVQLKDIVPAGDRINYGVVQPGSEAPGGVPIIRVGDLQGGQVRRDRLKHISAEVESAYSRSRIQGNEILVSCVGSIGEIAVAGQDDIGSNIARAVARVPVVDSVERIYFAAQLRSKRVQDYFVSELRTVSQPTLNIKQLSETEVFVVSRAIQLEFASRVTKVEALLRSQSESLAQLDELFASLQHRAFRGEL